MSSIGKSIYVIFLAIIMAACSSQPTPDESAAQMLSEARAHLAQKEYDAARDSILSMRQQYPTAIGARAQGILLLDSIELFAAQDSIQGTEGEEWKRLDVKVKFFQRKLQEDQKKRR